MMKLSQQLMLVPYNTQILIPRWLEIWHSYVKMRYKSKNVCGECNILTTNSTDIPSKPNNNQPETNIGVEEGQQSKSKKVRNQHNNSSDGSKVMNGRENIKNNSMRLASIPKPEIGLPNANRGKSSESNMSIIWSEKGAKKKRILLELEFFRAWNNDLPQEIPDYEWNNLMNKCGSESARIHHYKYLASKEESLRKKKKENKTPTGTEMPTCQHGSLLYMDGSEHTSADVPSVRGSLWRQRVHEVHKTRGAHALSHGTPIIFDMDYKMSYHAEENATNNIRYCNKINLHHREPLHMVVTGCKDKLKLKDKLEYFDQDFYLDYFDEKFTDLFDKKRLVYLLPYGPPIPFFRDNAAYIIQAENWHHDSQQTALWKAREFGISYGSFPFIRYPGYVKNNFIPSVPVIFKLLIDLHLHKSFPHAFEQAHKTQTFF